MVDIGNQSVGDGHSVFIVFEAGATHDGLETAKKLVRHAAMAGCDAVKFQITDPDRLVPDKNQMFSYDILVNKETNETKTVSEPLNSILQRRYLTFSEWEALKAYCDQLNIMFFSTATFFEEVDFLVHLGVDTVKICSGDINHMPLIRYCAKTGMCVQLDTGNATIGEVEFAFDEIRSTGNNRIIVHNCPSGYPARLESINLRIIPTLKQMFGCPVAFSDHTPGWEMDIAAIAMGANMVEKTITLDRMTPGVEHMFSLEPEEMKQFVTSIRNLETALGKKRRIFDARERIDTIKIRRSIVLKKPVHQGQIAEECLFDYTRPGSGIAPDMTEQLIGMRFAYDLEKGHQLNWRDLVP